jgi:hypothetical protein
MKRTIFWILAFKLGLLFYFREEIIALLLKLADAGARIMAL